MPTGGRGVARRWAGIVPAGVSAERSRRTPPPEPDPTARGGHHPRPQRGVATRPSRVRFADRDASGSVRPPTPRPGTTPSACRVPSGVPAALDRRSAPPRPTPSLTAATVLRQPRTPRQQPPTHRQPNLHFSGSLLHWNGLGSSPFCLTVPTPWLVLVLMSLEVVNDQFRYVVQMQTNREDSRKARS